MSQGPGLIYIIVLYVGSKLTSISLHSPGSTYAIRGRHLKLFCTATSAGYMMFPLFRLTNQFVKAG